MTVQADLRYPEETTIAETNSSSTLHAFVTGTTDTATAFQAALAVSPANYLGMWLQKASPTHRGGGFWDVELSYGMKQPVSPSTDPAITGQGGTVPAATLQFHGETSGKTIKRQLALELIDYKPATVPGGFVTPDFDGMIGVDPVAGTVEGVEVVTPGFSFTVEKKFDAELLPSGFLAQLVAMTGSTNNAPLIVLWKGQMFFLDQGECLFQGATVADGGQSQVTGHELIEVTFKFDTSPNKQNLRVGTSDFVFDLKRGFDYVWTLTEKTTSANSLVLKIKYAYLVRVYESSNFNLLLLS